MERKSGNKQSLINTSLILTNLSV